MIEEVGDPKRLHGDEHGEEDEEKTPVDDGCDGGERHAAAGDGDDRRERSESEREIGADQARDRAEE